jgi:hypothetical protein
VLQPYTSFLLRSHNYQETSLLFICLKKYHNLGPVAGGDEEETLLCQDPSRVLHVELLVSHCLLAQAVQKEASKLIFKESF